MSLADLIRKREIVKPASANPAKAANDGQGEGESLARLAKLALATVPESIGLADERIGRMVAKLEGDADLRYAMEAHAEVDPEAVILTVAIQGKGACELRIPKSRYDAFALLEVIERHTVREVLQ